MSSLSVKRKCPGLYCGQILLETFNGSMAWSECGACPRGFRVIPDDSSSECVQCETTPSMYDWQYLGFMIILPLILHWFFIDLAAKERRFVISVVVLLHTLNFDNFRFSFTKGELILHASAFIEVLTSAVITLLLYEPFWSLKIHSCEVTRLADWYTLFHNPTPNYETKLYCTQEAVYPL